MLSHQRKVTPMTESSTLKTDPGPPSAPRTGDRTALTPHEARSIVDEACCRADALLEARIAALWSAMSDPEVASSLLLRSRAEVDAARTLLTAAAAEEWWSDVTADRLAEACTAARIWAEGDPATAELERVFASRLRSAFGIDLAGIPRRDRSHRAESRSA
jgi:hypothetical protein